MTVSPLTRNNSYTRKDKINVEHKNKRDPFSYNLSDVFMPKCYDH